MKIAVIGTGYVGLVTGTCFADTGNQVVCVDVNEEKVEKMKRGEVPIYEPHLEGVFQRNIEQGRLKFTLDLEEAVAESQVIFLALPTPQGEDGSADLSYVLDVAEKLGPLINEYKIIVDKSTVPVGTADKVRATIARAAPNDFDVISNPEFLREGFAVEDFMKPERVIIGTESQKAMKIMGDLYKPFVRQGNPIMFMDERSAEMTKYAANSFLATKISFMNEIANLCEKVGADVDDVRMGMGSDSRIGKRFLFPGIGYGGSCFPKDVKALAKTGMDHDYEMRILESVMRVNEVQKTQLVRKVKEYFGDLKGRKFALWGLAFKPETDDIREAPSLYMIEDLLHLGAEVHAYDPEATENIRQHFGDKITYASEPYEVMEGADALLIATEWPVFRVPDLDKMKKMLKQPLLFDGRNLYDPADMKESGFEYFSIGRPQKDQPS